VGPRPSPAPTGAGPGLDQALAAVREGWQPDELRCAAAIERPFFSGLKRIFSVRTGLRDVVPGSVRLIVQEVSEDNVTSVGGAPLS
jgi:hypothetical protein